MPEGPLPTGGLLVEADLTVTLESGGRSARADVTGAGRLLSVSVDHPDVLAADRRLVGRVGDLLADAGLTASVEGPGGTVARLGAEVSSRVGAAATGSRHTSLTPRGAWSLLRSVGRPTVSDTTASALGATLAAALGGLLSAVVVRGLRHHQQQR